VQVNSAPKINPKSRVILRSLIFAAAPLIAVSAVPRDPRDVRSGDADIGQFAVAELVELFQARVVAPPSAEEVDDCDQHGCYLSLGPVRRAISSHEDGSTARLPRERERARSWLRLSSFRCRPRLMRRSL